MTTFACVLRSGGDFDPRWTRALAAGVAENMSEPYRFVCLSDMHAPGVAGGVEWVPLLEPWEGWWAKMNALNLPSDFGHVLLMDLDTLPVGDLSDLAGYDGEFALIRDLGRRNSRLQSGVMAFRAGGYARKLFEAFSADPDAAMRPYRGDGEWLNDHAEHPDTLQDLYPGQIVSAKWDIGYRAMLPDEGAVLALGHGPPRFSDPKAGWAHELWTQRAA